MRELISRQVVLAEVSEFLLQRVGQNISPVLINHLFHILDTIPIEPEQPMRIDELKLALREVRDICAHTQYCADCPLRGKVRCPMWDSNSDPIQYPADWPLAWEEDPGEHRWTSSGECTNCGNLALYNGNEELVRSRFCPHCGEKMINGGVE